MNQIPGNVSRLPHPASWVLFASSLLALATLGGCAATGPAPAQATNGGTQVGNARIATRMSSTIFLQPVAPRKRVIFVAGHNTSSVRNLQLPAYLREALRQKGYHLTTNPDQAEYILQYNLRYLGRENKNHTIQGAIAGGFGGAILENAVAGGGYASGGQTLRAGIIGAGIGALVGYLANETRYMMVVDIQVEQRNPGARTRTHTTAREGLGNFTTSSSAGAKGWQIYRTRLVGEAAGHRLNFSYVQPALTRTIANSIAGIF